MNCSYLKSSQIWNHLTQHLHPTWPLSCGQGTAFNLCPCSVPHSVPWGKPCGTGCCGCFSEAGPGSMIHPFQEMGFFMVFQLDSLGRNPCKRQKRRPSGDQTSPVGIEVIFQRRGSDSSHDLTIHYLGDPLSEFPSLWPIFWSENPRSPLSFARWSGLDLRKAEGTQGRAWAPLWRVFEIQPNNKLSVQTVECLNFWSCKNFGLWCGLTSYCVFSSKTRCREWSWPLNNPHVDADFGGKIPDPGSKWWRTG